MPRPEKPVATGNRALRDLAEWLRERRARTGQGYRALAVRAGCHATTLQRAASGESVPKLQTVLTYAMACDASPEEARRLWREARYEHTRQLRGGRGLPAPKPRYVRDLADLAAAMLDLYEKAGSPTLRTMEERAGRFGVLPRSTVHRIVHRRTMPNDLGQFRAFLKACEAPEADWQEWEAAWARAWRHERNDRYGIADESPGTGGAVEPWWFGTGTGTVESPWFTPSPTGFRGALRVSSRRTYVMPARPHPPQAVVPEARPPSRRQPERQITGQLSLPIGGDPDPGPDLSESDLLFSLPVAPVRRNRSKAA
ncbi:helix-turn-helix domain-containing protein [Streptomyces sp. NPDC090026]|uniref:helix-turn-helix domain-containing protein n=1 Tax=Streptomyces sp. NPDC090026 TaxID=3365923 RepID=UPI003823F218